MELLDEGPVAGNATQVEERRRGTDILASEGERLADAADRMPNLNPQVPEGIEQSLSDG